MPVIRMVIGVRLLFVIATSLVGILSFVITGLGMLGAAGSQETADGAGTTCRRLRKKRKRHYQCDQSSWHPNHRHDMITYPAGYMFPKNRRSPDRSQIPVC